MREFVTWAIIIVVLIAVAVVAGVSGLTSDGGFLRSMGIREGGTNISWSNGTRHLRYDGAVELSDDDRDILRISPHGYVELADDRILGNPSRLELVARSDGTLVRKFFMNGQERPYDPAGKEWLAEILPEVVRRSGLAAEARVERILRAHGTAGVLAEISQLPSDHVKHEYFSTLFEQAKTTGQPLAEAISHAGKTIYNDHEMGQLLNRIVEQANSDSVVRDAFFDAALSIDSDYEMASLLIRVADAHTVDAAFREPYFNAVETIDSDYEHRRVLSALNSRVSDPAILSAMIESLKQINSNYEAAEFLLSLSQHHDLDESLRALYLDAARRLSSEYERNRALTALETKWR